MIEEPFTIGFRTIVSRNNDDMDKNLPPSSAFQRQVMPGVPPDAAGNMQQTDYADPADDGAGKTLAGPPASGIRAYKLYLVQVLGRAHLRNAWRALAGSMQLPATAHCA
jgi:hypothetical protein